MKKRGAVWEEKRSIGHGSAIDDYFDEWNAKHFQISPSPPKIRTTRLGSPYFSSTKGFELSTRRLTGKGIPPEAHPVGEKARAVWEEKRSIGHGSAIDDYFDEWNAKHFQISPSPPKIHHNFDTMYRVMVLAFYHKRAKEVHPLHSFFNIIAILQKQLYHILR